MAIPFISWIDGWPRSTIKPTGHFPVVPADSVGNQPMPVALRHSLILDSDVFKNYVGKTPSDIYLGHYLLLPGATLLFPDTIPT
jgi:hypothetical protein